MRSVALSVFIAFLAAPLVHGRQHSTFRVHAQANASNGPVFWAQLRFPGRMVKTEKVPTLLENDATAGDIKPLKQDWPAQK